MGCRSIGYINRVICDATGRELGQNNDTGIHMISMLDIVKHDDAFLSGICRARRKIIIAGTLHDASGAGEVYAVHTPARHRTHVQEAGRRRVANVLAVGAERIRNHACSRFACELAIRVEEVIPYAGSYIQRKGSQYVGVACIRESIWVAG